MTTHADDRRVAPTHSTGTLPVLRAEAAGCVPSAPMTALRGELPCCGAEATRPSSPATELYTKGLGWPVVAEGTNRLLRCGEIVDVVSMPSGLAGEINNSLKLLMLDAAVLEIADPPRRWAFFCQSQPSSITNLGTLSLHGVKHFGKGALFSLPPSPTCDNEALHWISPPTRGAFVLPPIAAVASCAMTAIKQ